MRRDNSSGKYVPYATPSPINGEYAMVCIFDPLNYDRDRDKYIYGMLSDVVQTGDGQFYNRVNIALVTHQEEMWLHGFDSPARPMYIPVPMPTDQGVVVISLSQWLQEQEEAQS